jgi:hypothetical protein
MKRASVLSAALAVVAAAAWGCKSPAEPRAAVTDELSGASFDLRSIDGVAVPSSWDNAFGKQDYIESFSVSFRAGGQHELFGRVLFDPGCVFFCSDPSPAWVNIYETGTYRILEGTPRRVITVTEVNGALGQSDTARWNGDTLHLRRPHPTQLAAPKAVWLFVRTAR